MQQKFWTLMLIININNYIFIHFLYIYYIFYDHISY